MKSPVTLKNYESMMDTEELIDKRGLVQQHIINSPIIIPDDSYANIALTLFPFRFRRDNNGDIVTRDDYDYESEKAHDNIPFNQEFVLTRMEFNRNLPLYPCGMCVLRDTSGCYSAPCEGNAVVNRYFVLRRIETTTPHKAGKKEYVPDRPEDFDLSAENWNSVKTMIGM